MKKCKCGKKFVPYRKYQKYCSKKCYIKYTKIIYDKWRNDYNKIYRKKHKEYFKKYMKIYRKIHAKEIKDYEKLNKKKRNLYTKKSYYKNREKRLKYYREFYLKNKLKINHKRNKYLIIRRKKNISYRILCNLRIRLCDVLKGNPKLDTTMKLVGCSIDKLKEHLASKFTKGMSWKNYGKWHIDHIKPCASFDLSKASEQRKCFHYTNLQPLWAIDNLRKNKY